MNGKGISKMIKILLFAMAARRGAGNWRYLWGKAGQITAFGVVGYYGFTTSEETKKEANKTVKNFV